MEGKNTAWLLQSEIQELVIVNQKLKQELDKYIVTQDEKDPTAKRLDFTDFVYNIPLIVYVSQNNKIIYANKTMQELFGYSERELLGMTFWDMVHNDFKEIVRTIGIAWERGEVDYKELHDGCEYKMVKKNGTVIWVRTYIDIFEIGESRAVIVGATDITDKKAAQKQLKKAHEDLEERVIERTRELSYINEQLQVQQRIFQSIVENISDGLIILDQFGRVELINNYIEKILKIKFVEGRLGIGKDQLFSKNSYIDKLLEESQPFNDVEITLITKEKDITCIASGLLIESTEAGLRRYMIILNPKSEVHKLVNRISGASARFQLQDIITSNPIMQSLIELIINCRNILSSILIEGESGTGKEMFAQAIHNESLCSDGPFIAINCGAIPRELIGSELFGYAEGAFTGARKGGNPGKFELASGGTIFLDEIGEMPMEQQIALLRVLQEKQIMRIGDNKVIPVNVRVICATNKNLEEEMQKGNFRKDLYYRLNVISLKIPPLRERREDILMLFQHFVDRSALITNVDWDKVDSKLIDALLNYDWPGNVREMQNVIEVLLIRSNGVPFAYEHLPDKLLKTKEHINNILPLESKWHNFSGSEEGKLKYIVAEAERKKIIDLLRKNNGNISQVAKDLGVTRRTVHNKINKYGIKH